MENYNVKFTSAPVPKLTWEEIKAELASLPEPTTCIDCGQPTTPGKGSARCPGCGASMLNGSNPFSVLPDARYQSNCVNLDTCRIYTAEKYTI